MTIQLGENPWILIWLMFLELLFIIVPSFISSRIEKKRIIVIIIDMGFQKNEKIIIKIIAGISFGILFFFIGDYIIIFFRDFIVKNLFGVQFVQQGQSGSINVTPVQPNLVQIIILIILQIIIIGPSEEAFFRGFIIKKLNEKLKLPYSIIISTICFTIYHVPPFLVPLTTIVTFFGYYFTFGLLLSLIFINFENSIIPSSIAHSCFNILILLL